MKTTTYGAFAASAVLMLLPFATMAQNYATNVVSSSNLMQSANFSDPSAALGQPATLDNDGFGDLYHVSMVQPSYGQDQTTGANLLVGFDNTGSGQVTVQLSAPIAHNAAHWYGQDFIVFSNQGFTGTSGYAQEGTDMSRYTIKDGTTFGTLPGVSVSADGTTFFSIAPSDTIAFPENPYHWDGITTSNTSGWGALQDFTKPVDPSLMAGAFAGQSVAYAANTLYNGSAGGTSYSLAGLPLTITSIQYVRFTSTATGRGIVDAVSGVGFDPAAAPEPAPWLVFVLGGVGLLAVRRRRAQA